MTNETSDPFVYKARVFATAAHAAVGQLRKYTKDPYITHPARVVWLLNDKVSLETVWAQREMLAAAWLHDVVEDTKVTLAQLEDEFGASVAGLVSCLTDASKGRPENRAFRKEMDLEHLRRASPVAKTIKLADIIDNTPSIIQYDPEFAKVYLKEKRALLEVLHEGDGQLWNIAQVLIYKNHIDVAV